MTPEITVDWLLARVVEQEGCLIWQGRCENGGKDPRARIDGVNFYVRRAVWEAMHNGREFPAGCYAGTTCSNPACVEPAHAVARKRSSALKGKPKALATRARIAAAKRVTSKLPQEKVQEILASPLSGSKEAVRHGVCKALVNKIRAGVWRQDFSNPFQGLGAR